MPPLRLEMLPAEIHIRIMAQIDNVESIFSFLTASPVALKVYQQNRNAIFTNVVYNQIPPSLLPITFAMLKLPEQSKSATLILLQEASDVPSCENFPVLSVSDAKRLFRLHTLIDEFARDAMNQSLKLLSIHLSLESSAIDARPSYFERYRVVRGFYHLEYMSSFCEQYKVIRDSSQVDTLASSDFLSTFLDRLTIHELEEIFFVFSYLKERLICFLNQAEDDRFEEFVDYGPVCGKGRFDWEADADDMFFSNALHGALNNWMDNAIYSQNLRSLAELFNASTPAERLDLIESFKNVGFGKTVTQKLSVVVDAATSAFECHYLPHDRQLWRQFSLDFNGCNFIETIDDVPLGLVWAYKTGQLPRYSPFYDEDEIAPYGLAIWDAGRLRRMNMFSRGPLTLKYDTGSFAKRKNRPSVEDRAREQEDKWAAEGKLCL